MDAALDVRRFSVGVAATLLSISAFYLIRASPLFRVYVPGTKLAANAIDKERAPLPPPSEEPGEKKLTEEELKGQLREARGKIAGLEQSRTDLERKIDALQSQIDQLKIASTTK